MKTRIAIVALFVVASSSFASAQSSTATSGTTAPLPSAPSAGTPAPSGPNGVVIPPAARSGEKGVRVGNGAVTGEPVEIKRVK